MIDYEELYKDTVAIVKSAVQGLAASENPTNDVNTLINETFDALLALRKHIYGDKQPEPEAKEFGDL